MYGEEGGAPHSHDTKLKPVPCFWNVIFYPLSINTSQESFSLETKYIQKCLHFQTKQNNKDYIRDNFNMHKNKITSRVHRSKLWKLQAMNHKLLIEPFLPDCV